MKNTLIFFTILILTLLTSCGSSKKPAEKKIVTKENLLDGLHKPSGFTLPTNFLSADIPVYTDDAQEISRQEMNRLTVSGEYSATPYVNDQNEMVLWMVHKMTEKEKAVFEDAENKRNNIPSLKGKPANQFSVTDLQGKKFDLKELKGKIVVINFWFIGCKPCIAEINDLNDLVDKCKNKNVVFLGFSTDKKEKLVTFLKNKPFKYNIIPDSKAVCDSYGINVFPTNLVVDQNSMITYHSTGLSNLAPGEMLAEIERLEKMK